MAQKFQEVRGMKDILPDDSPRWQRLETTARQLFTAYGYRELRTPVVESTDLFRRSIGEVTDIVEKEMYTFQDQGGNSLTLRPEATASCVRSCVQHGLLHNQTQRLWCTGPMFRHERNQKDRYRQFYQLDVEAFGMEGPDIDAELICLSARLWRALGLGPGDVTLEINSLGSPEARASYRERLVAYFEAHRDALDDDSLRRLTRNPLRILDSKNPAMAEVIGGAPALVDHLDDPSRAHFEGLQGLLDSVDIPFAVNPRLVRGLDYYSRTVFEWVTDRLPDDQGQPRQLTVCAGGRYDGLVQHLGGRETPGVGFAAGIERLLALLDKLGGFGGLEQRPHAYLVAVGEVAGRQSLALAERLRDALPALRLTVHTGGGSFKSQLKRADQSGALVALILGEAEVSARQVAFKSLRQDQPQQTLDESALIAALRPLITGPESAP